MRQLLSSLLLLVGLVSLTAQSEVTYIHTDILGSPIMETNEQGSVISRTRYKPFGETLETPKNDVGYTGHLNDTDLGLTYMQARYYDPLIGRFYSNDPVGYKNVHNFNRYTYGNNNPYKYVDPDGKEGVEVNFIPNVSDMLAKAFGYKNINDGNENFTRDVKNVVKEEAVSGLRGIETASGSVGTAASVATVGAAFIPGTQAAAVPLATTAGVSTIVSSVAGIAADYIEGSPQDSSRAGIAAVVTGKVAEKVALKYVPHHVGAAIEVSVKESTKPIFKKVLGDD